MSNTPAAYGWQQRELNKSPGLDFLGLANPIDRILDAWTPGITNATRRARYFSIISWIYWRYANLGGLGTVADQKQFTLALETLFGYVNVAHETKTSRKVSQIIRRLFAARRWKKGEQQVPLRGDAIPSSPSALNPAAYGPSFSRLHLLGTQDRFRTCLPAGQILAEAFEEVASELPLQQELMFAKKVDRATVEEWSQKANLQATSAKEIKLLRALFFAYEPFDFSDSLNRVHSLLLMLNMALTSDASFNEWDIEVAFALGCDLSGRKIKVPPSLERVLIRWRIIALLKLMRHATELSFKALHEHIRKEPIRFPRLGIAADSLQQRYLENYEDVPFQSLVSKFTHSTKHPQWRPDEAKPQPEANFAAAIELVAWCFARLKSEDGQSLLRERLATWGSNMSADLVTYFAQLSELENQSVAEVARWLLIDRGIARHNRVAASKLWKHDTFRVVEDEAGVLAIGKCPLPEISVRVSSMLSLLSDLKLLKADNGGYITNSDTQRFFDSQLQREWAS